MSATLTVRDVVVRYRRPGRDPLVAVDEVSLDLAPGEVVGLVGESGCGKSTLARAICGLEPLTSGEIRFDGDEVAELGLRRRPRRQRRIQMVFQNPYASLNPRRRVGSQISDAFAVTGPDHPSVAELLQSVDLPADAASRFPHEFSGGQRQRIAIARAIGAGPEVLIGDEPIASLDASLQARLAELMREIALANGASLLFISHDLSVVRMIADRVAIMQAGRIVETGPTAEVWSNPRDDYTRRLLASIPIADGLGHLPGL